MSGVAPVGLPTLTAQYAQLSISKSTDQVACEAFEKAKAIFNAELTKDDNKRSWLNGYTSLEDVKEAVYSAANVYQARASKSSTAYKWLTRLSTRIQTYGTVLDVLAQHHPEYVSLAWGAFKFLFTTVINHETLATELSKTLTKIAAIVSRAGADLQLYPTMTIKDAVARLYACLMRVAEKALRWFNRGRFGHAIDAIVRTWGTEFEAEVNQMEEHFANVTSHAALAARAEIRDIHVAFRAAEARAVTAEQAATVARAELCAIQSAIQRLEERAATAEYASSAARNGLQLAVDSIKRDISLHFQEIKLDLRDNKDAIRGILITRLSGLSFAKDLPSSGSCLEYCQSFKRGVRSRAKPSDQNILSLDRWSRKKTSSILALQTRSLLVAKEHVTAMVETLRDSEFRIIWALRYPGFEDASITTVSILRILVMQTLHQNEAVVTSGQFALRPQQLEEAASEQDWLRIFGKVLEGLKHVFVVLDPDLVNAATGFNRRSASSFVERLLHCVRTTVLKIFIPAISVALPDKIADSGGLWIITQATEPQRGRAKRLRQVKATQSRRVRMRTL